MTLPIGTITTPNNLLSGLWALPRPTTHHWGSGLVLDRITQVWGYPDICFGKQDHVCGFTVDSNIDVSPSVVSDWGALPFGDNSFKFGYWDPPYLGHIGQDGDVHYKRLDNCLQEMCRVLQERIVILSPLVYPCPKGWKRDGVIAITMGPNKVIRCLQSFIKISLKHFA
jgi:hypothetical protein